MQIQPISSWHEHVLAGRKYLKAARKGRARPAVFNNELLFQMAAMAIENLMVGVCQYHQEMPGDHTLSGLLAALHPVCPMDRELADKIRAIESKEDMCALTAHHREPPNDADIKEILAVGGDVVVFVNRHTPWDRIIHTAA